jgi:succinate dehydrogenase / fumarate reductase cytochrome b subunit
VASVEAPARSESTNRPLAVFGPRLGSVLAIAPLGVWTIGHLWDNFAALWGAERWQRAVTSHEHPAAGALSAILVFTPLLIHTIWGIGRLFKARPNNIHYSTLRNLKYLLQRVSAVGIFFFLGAHIWLAFLHPRFVEGHAERFADIASEMHYNAPTLPIYLLGTLGVAYHLANGVYGFSMSSGLAASRRALRHIEWFSLALFLLLLFLSWAAIYALYTHGAAFPPDHGR